MVFKYYSTQRPIDIGTYPKLPNDPQVEMTFFSGRQPVESGTVLAWGVLAYAHLFTELSPPIPKGEERRFSVNGILLPGYTVEVPEKTPQEVADELLGFLEDGDTPPPPAEPEKPKHQHPSRPTHKKPQPRKQRDSAPTR